MERARRRNSEASDSRNSVCGCVYERERRRERERGRERERVHIEHATSAGQIIIVFAPSPFPPSFFVLRPSSSIFLLSLVPNSLSGSLAHPPDGSVVWRASEAKSIPTQSEKTMRFLRDSFLRSCESVPLHSFVSKSLVL